MSQHQKANAAQTASDHPVNDMEDQPEIKVARGEFCCETFKKMMFEFKWMSLDSQLLVMPHYKVDGKMLRVNYCPSCGGYVKDKMLDISELERP